MTAGKHGLYSVTLLCAEVCIKAEDSAILTEEGRPVTGRVNFWRNDYGSGFYEQ